VATLDAHEELDRLHAESSSALSATMAEIQVARVRHNYARAERLEKELGVQLGNLMAAADLLGRRRMLLELRAAGLGMEFAAVPNVPFVESAASILERYPVLAVGYKETRKAWLEGGFALAKASTLTLTTKVQRHFMSFLRDGVGPDEASTAIRKVLQQSDGSITRAYADTVFRTVTSSAYTEGRQKQADRPAVRRAASGWRYTATMDSDVRDNHKAGEDFVAHVDDPVWQTHSPPNGYNCRCALTIVSTAEMVKRGLSHEDGSLAQTVDAAIAFVPDRGFASRRSLLT